MSLQDEYTEALRMGDTNKIRNISLAMSKMAIKSMNFPLMTYACISPNDERLEIMDSISKAFPKDDISSWPYHIPGHFNVDIVFNRTIYQKELRQILLSQQWLDYIGDICLTLVDGTVTIITHSRQELKIKRNDD
jgi:hypothetical protein